MHFVFHCHIAAYFNILPAKIFQDYGLWIMDYGLWIMDYVFRDLIKPFWQKDKALYYQVKEYLHLTPVQGL